MATHFWTSLTACFDAGYLATTMRSLLETPQRISNHFLCPDLCPARTTYCGGVEQVLCLTSSSWVVRRQPPDTNETSSLSVNCVSHMEVSTFEANKKTSGGK